MCLAKPLKLIIIDESARTGMVDIGGDTLAVGLDLVPEAAIGDYVLVHAGMAIERLEADDADALLDAYERYVHTGGSLAPGETDGATG